MYSSLLKCPHCQQPLTFKDAWTCSTHVFDASKEGYVNLCIPPIKGDDKLLVSARETFFKINPYKPLMEAMLKWIKPHDVVFDVGCGIGAYLSFFKREVASITAIGCDGSKIAIKKAAKNDASCQFIVANVNNLPLLNNTCDLIVSVFAPFNAAEMHRCLKPSGTLLLVSPAQDHLYQLKEVVYAQATRNPLTLEKIPHFKHISEETITFSIHIDAALAEALFLMTPYAYKSPRDALLKIQAHSMFNITCAFRITVYTKET